MNLCGISCRWIEQWTEERSARTHGTSQKILIEGLRSTTRSLGESRKKGDAAIAGSLVQHFVFLRDIAVHAVWQELFFSKRSNHAEMSGNMRSGTAVKYLPVRSLCSVRFCFRRFARSVRSTTFVVHESRLFDRKAGPAERTSGWFGRLFAGSDASLPDL